MSMMFGEIDTELTKICGRQPSLFTAMNARMANFGVANIMNVSAPEAFRRAICESIVASVGS